MRYCTLEDLIATYGEARLAELTDRDHMPATTIDEAVVERAIADAEAEINMYLAGRHVLPLPSVPVMLTRIACDVAWFNLHTQVDGDHPAAVALKRRRAQLEGVANGKLSLGLDEADAPVPTDETVQVAPGRNDFGAGGW
jgi:phage gp36-like protein